MPTAPSPTTATVFPGPTAAAWAPNQPVPSTSEAARRLGIVGARLILGGDERPICERHTKVRRLGAPRTDVLEVCAAALVAGAADLAGIVGGEKGADRELTAFHVLDCASDFLDDAAILVTHRCRALRRIDSAIGP